MNFPCTCNGLVKTILAHLSLTTHPQEVKPKLCMHLERNISTEWLWIDQKAAGQKSPPQTHIKQNPNTSFPFLLYPYQKSNFHRGIGINMQSTVSHRRQPRALSKTQTTGIYNIWNTGFLAQLKSPGRRFPLFNDRPTTLNVPNK